MLDTDVRLKTTPTLYDPGEETWPLKLRLGCGGIYLDGYVNVDIVGDLAAERPDLVAQNRTTVDDYYRGLAGDALNLPTRRENVVDLRTDFIDPPFEAGSVSKIVCVQSFEHLASYDAWAALNRWSALLRPGGVLILSVPRMDDTLAWLKDGTPAQREFAVRHLIGSGRNGHNLHRAWYNHMDLTWLLTRHGFGEVDWVPDIHVYPAIVMRAIKVDRYVPDRSYQRPLPGLDATCRSVLDVGPGEFPLAEATHCLDVSEQYRDSRRVPADIGNVEDMPYADWEFDYVYASHVVEHTEHPARAIAELQRVGRRGYVEVPSVMLDWLMQHGEAHKDAGGRTANWMCLQVAEGIVFVERDPRLLPGFTDRRFGTWVHRITQYAIKLGEPERYMREMFWKRQDVLNVSASWDETRSIKCIEVRLDGTIDTAYVGSAE